MDIVSEYVPAEMHDGMQESNRAENFVYWARFGDSKNRRWEATYDPRSRALNYRRL